MAAEAPAAVIPIEVPRTFTVCSFAASVGDEAHTAALAEADAKAAGLKDDVSADALSWAARNSRAGVVTYLLARDADVEAKSFGGMRPLHHACHVFDEGIIRELLAKKADANAADDAGNTPLHYAVRRGVLTLCQLLVDAKADVAKKNAAGQTPLHVACNSGQVREGAARRGATAALSVKQRTPLTPRPRPAPQLSIASFLLSKEADPNDADKAGNTALHIAARTGFKAICVALVAGGALPSNNRAGKSPAQVAFDADIAKACAAGGA